MIETPGAKIRENFGKSNRLTPLSYFSPTLYYFAGARKSAPWREGEEEEEEEEEGEEGEEGEGEEEGETSRPTTTSRRTTTLTTTTTTRAAARFRLPPPPRTPFRLPPPLARRRRRRRFRRGRRWAPTRTTPTTPCPSGSWLGRRRAEAGFPPFRLPPPPPPPFRLPPFAGRPFGQAVTTGAEGKNGEKSSPSSFERWRK